ncbi:MAG TPA: phosphatase PAP2 family protein [Longimicrobiales bacterium]
MSRWAAGTLAARLHDTFHADWRRVGAEQRRAWARLVLAGIITTAVLLLAMIVVMRRITAGSNHFPWEEVALRHIEQGPIGFGTALWLQTLGSDFMLLAVVVPTAMLAISRHRPLFAASILLALITMDALVRIGWFAYARHRPDIIAQGLAAPGFHSFPSGHTAKTVVIYGLLMAQWIRASRSGAEQTVAVIVGLAITVVVPYGRLRMGAHWPTDILGGYVVGAAWLVFLLLALRNEPGPP